MDLIKSIKNENFAALVFVFKQEQEIIMNKQTNNPDLNKGKQKKDKDPKEKETNTNDHSKQYKTKVCCYIGAKIALFILFSILLIVPFISIYSCNEQKNNGTTSEIIYESHSPKEASDAKSDDLENLKITQTKTSYNLPCIFLFVIYPLSLVVLFIVFSKDDSCIKFAKLNALLSVKESIQSDGATEKDSDTHTKTVTTKSHNHADFLRHYMDCITEI